MADSARVDSSVYVGPDAMVLGSAVLKGNVRVEDHAIVANQVTASDNVVVCGHAIVDGGGWVYDDGWKEGTVTLSGNDVIGDSAGGCNSCKVSGNAKVLQKAYLADAVTIGDDAVAKGMAYVYGTASYTGTAILDGDFCNDQSKNSGVNYGWLDDNGGHRTEDGYTAAYEFTDESKVWAKDKYAATDALISGAQHAETGFVDLTVVHIARLGAPVDRVQLCRIQQTVLSQQVKIQRFLIMGIDVLPDCGAGII